MSNAEALTNGNMAPFHPQSQCWALLQRLSCSKFVIYFPAWSGTPAVLHASTLNTGCGRVPTAVATRATFIYPELVARSSVFLPIQSVYNSRWIASLEHRDELHAAFKGWEYVGQVLSGRVGRLAICYFFYVSCTNATRDGTEAGSG